MSWMVIVVLIVVGLGLIAIEVLIVPGTTFVGIIGALVMIAGIYFTYSSYGATIGHYTLGGVTLATILLTIAGYKAFASGKYSVNKVLQGKVNVVELEKVKVGDTGMAISALRPAGKAKINDHKFEVTTMGEFIDTQQEVEVIRVTGNKIFVKLLNQT